MGSAAQLEPVSEIVVRVNYSEVDQMGVVYHANYIVYFELGRTEFMRAHGVHYAAMEQTGMRLAVAEVGVKYVRAARYDDELLIETMLTEASGVRVRFEYRILRARAADGPPVARVPAGDIEAAVMAQVRALLRQPEVMVGTWRGARASRSPTCW